MVIDAEWVFVTVELDSCQFDRVAGELGVRIDKSGPDEAGWAHTNGTVGSIGVPQPVISSNLVDTVDSHELAVVFSEAKLRGIHVTTNKVASESCTAKGTNILGLLG